MARFAILIEIAGISFTGCRAEIVDPEGFQSSYVGSTDFGNDGSPHTQVLNRGGSGILFGIKMVSASSTKLQQTLTAIQAAQAARATFPVKITDGMYTVDTLVNPDYDQKWLSHGQHSEGVYTDVVFRFITKV